MEKVQGVSQGFFTCPCQQSISGSVPFLLSLAPTSSALPPNRQLGQLALEAVIAWKSFMDCLLLENLPNWASGQAAGAGWAGGLGGTPSQTGGSSCHSAVNHGGTLNLFSKCRMMGRCHQFTINGFLTPPASIMSSIPKEVVQVDPSANHSTRSKPTLIL